MSELRIFADHDPATPAFESRDPAAIAERLQGHGVRFEQWQTDTQVQPGAEQEDVLAAYQRDIDRLTTEEGYQTVDVVSLASDHPDRAALRLKFLDEHTHSEDEVRFFVAGSGLFSLHLDGHVLEVLCEQGDLISVPRDTPHWFDMGPNPNFVAIRFFNNSEGWVAKHTGSDISGRFSRMEN